MWLWLTVLLASVAAADPWEDDEAVRFSGTEPDPVADTAKPASWAGGARSHLENIVAIEARLESLGAAPDQVLLISAQLDWGRLVDRDRNGSMSFTETGLTVKSRRLSDGEVLATGRVVDEHGTYDLSDPEQRDRLCTRARQGDLGSIELHPMASGGGDPTEPRDASFLLVDGEARTALVDLKPGESATVVEVVPPPERKRRLKVRRALTVQRGDQVLTMTEGDVLRRICLDF